MNFMSHNLWVNLQCFELNPWPCTLCSLAYRSSTTDQNYVNWLYTVHWTKQTDPQSWSDVAPYQIYHVETCPDVPQCSVDLVRTRFHLWKVMNSSGSWTGEAISWSKDFFAMGQCTGKRFRTIRLEQELMFQRQSTVNPLYTVTRLNQNLAYTYMFFEHQLKSTAKWRYNRGPV